MMSIPKDIRTGSRDDRKRQNCK